MIFEHIISIDPIGKESRWMKLRSMSFFYRLGRLWIMDHMIWLHRLCPEERENNKIFLIPYRTWPWCYAEVLDSHSFRFTIMSLSITIGCAMLLWQRLRLGRQMTNSFITCTILAITYTKTSELNILIIKSDNRNMSCKDCFSFHDEC